MKVNGEVMNNLKKGLVLTILTGALISKNPLANSDNTIVYAKEDITEYQNKYLKELKKVYKTYSKKLYTSKEYKKLTTKYNKGIKVINACKTIDDIENAYERYVKVLNDIKPSILVKYQKKLEKSLLKSYKSLITKNEYSDYNLSKIEDIKNEGIENIYSCKTKTNSKNVKNEYVNKLKSIDTLIVETKNNVINYIKNNKDLTNEQKNEIIDNINNLNKVEDINSLGQIYGYVEEENEIITVEQIENKIKELLKKYPKYTEDEIRCMVAAANMDFVKDEDIFTIFNVNSNKELEEKAILLDELEHEEIEDVCGLLWMVNKYGGFKNGDKELAEIYNKLERKYPDIVKFNELFINKKYKKHADFIFELIDKGINDPIQMSDNDITYKGVKLEDITEGEYCILELSAYYFNKYLNTVNYKKGQVYEMNDEQFSKTAAGYIINRRIAATLICDSDNFVILTFPNSKESIHDNIYPYYQSLQNPITKWINNNYKKIK